MRAPTAAAAGGPAAAAIPRAAWTRLAVTSIGVFVVFLDATVVSVSFPKLAESFPGAERGDLSWVLNAYSVVFGGLLITAGRIADQVGRRRLYTAGLLAFAVLSVLCATAGDLWLLVAARALQGVGAAAIVPASLGLLLTAFPAERRSTAVGLWGGVGAVAAACGPTVGAALTQYASWRWVFWLNVPVCLIAGCWALRVCPAEGPVRRPRVDLPGVALVVLGVAGPSFAAVQGPEQGWLSATTLAPLAGGVLCLLGLAVRSRGRTDAVIPLVLLRDRALRTASAATLLAGLAFYANLLCATLFLTSVWHQPLLRAALSLVPTPLLTAAASGPAGRLAERIGHRLVIVMGTALFSCGQLWYLLMLPATPSYPLLLPGLIMVGLGIGLSFPTLGSSAVVGLPPQHYSAGGSMVSTARQLGAALGVALFVAALGTGARLELADFHRAWALLAAECAAALLVMCSYPSSLNARRMTDASD